MYTERDLKKLKKAIFDLAQGKRVVSVTINDREIKYGQANLDQLNMLLSTVQQSLDQQSKKHPTYQIIRSGKGL